MKLILHLLLAVSMLSLASCGGDDISTKEKTEIEMMDSTSKAISDTTDRLESQTEKVEASLEKLDEIFENDK